MFSEVVCSATRTAIYLPYYLEWVGFLLFAIIAVLIHGEHLSVMSQRINKQWSPLGAKICSDICPRTLSVPRSEQFPRSWSSRKTVSYEKTYPAFLSWQFKFWPILSYELNTLPAIPTKREKMWKTVNTHSKHHLVKVTVYLRGCLAYKRCGASGLNCRYLKPYIKLIKAYKTGYKTIPTILKRNELSNFSRLLNGGRYGGFMVSALDSRASGPGSSPGQGHSRCCVLGQDTLLSQCLSLPRAWLFKAWLS